MFSINSYTRRRQQVVALVAALSGVLVAVLLGSLPRQAQHLRPRPKEISRASFGRIALSPDGTRQVELIGGHVIFRDRATQQLLAVYTDNNIKAVRFTPGGSEVLIHVLRTQKTPGTELLQLSDHVIVLDPLTGQKKGEGPFTLTR
nr:hypothetical protein [Armatimonas sp.]